MSNWNIRAIKALRARAKKVHADPALVEKFIEMAKAKDDALIHNVRGNRRLWRSRGVIANWSEYSADGKRSISWELTVRTTWKGADYTTTTRIEENITDYNNKDNPFDQRTYDSASTVSLWADRNKQTVTA